MKSLFVSLIVLSLVFSGSVGADDLSRTRHQLEQLRLRIEKAEADLKARRKSEQDINRDLALINGQLQRFDERIAAIRKEQQALSRRIREQEGELEQSRTRTAELGRRLEQRLVVLYKDGDYGLLKSLFSAESPTEMIQQYFYLTRIMESDRLLMDDYRRIAADQQQQLEQLAASQQHQQRLLEQEQAERREAAGAATLKGRLLQQAQADNRKLRDELARLREDAGRLTGLIEQLQKAPPPPPPPSPGVAAPSADFARLRGQLSWPVEGAVLIKFGTQRDDKLGTYYESNGLEIAARPGSEVRAVAAGRVVYADYFRGYGNLMIVSHQEEYHTLYAQLDRLRKKTGESVAAAEIVGQSGLGGRESIYFEIRQKGSPVNPQNWLKPR